MSTFWENFYQKADQPAGYEDNIKLVQEFIKSHLSEKLVLISVFSLFIQSLYRYYFML